MGTVVGLIRRQEGGGKKRVYGFLFVSSFLSFFSSVFFVSFPALCWVVKIDQGPLLSVCLRRRQTGAQDTCPSVWITRSSLFSCTWISLSTSIHAPVESFISLSLPLSGRPAQAEPIALPLSFSKHFFLQLFFSKET